MAERIIDTSQLIAEANAIRAKGVTGQIEYKENGFADAIASIPSGGVTPTGTIDILANGLVDVTDYATANVNVSAGGGLLPEHGVFFIDYDESIVTVWASDEVSSKTALPDNPAHDGLTANGWNWTLSNIKNYIQKYPKATVWVGQMYDTASRLTEIDITVTKATGKTVTCKMSGNKDWGDGTTDNTTSHTYDDYGDYTITCNGTSIPGGSSGSGGMFDTSTLNLNRYWCTAIRIGGNVTSIGAYAFSNCRSLTSVVIPDRTINIGTYAFSNCRSLTSIIIPDGVTSISDDMFNNCYALKRVSTSDSVTSVGRYAFSNCYSLTSITIPDGVTGIDYAAFYCCFSLINVIFPNRITSIGDGAFYSCYSVREYDFSTFTSIRTLSGTSVFYDINGLCKIIVPDSLYNEWITATNWSTYAYYIYKASEV